MPAAVGHAQVGGRFQQIEHAPRIAVGSRHEELAGGRFQVQGELPQAALRIAQGAIEELAQVLRRQGLEYIDARPRQERVVHLEGRVLGRRADEDQRAILDVRQKGVLLRFVEAVHLIEEQHGVARPAQAACPLDHRPDVLDARQHRGECDELGVGAGCDQPRECRLARPRRTPQDHRMRTAGLERAAQRRAGAEQMRLPDELIERSGPQPIRQRPVSAVADRAH